MNYLLFLSPLKNWCRHTIIMFCVPALSYGSDCGQTSVGLTPLNDLGTGTYMGFTGGLYPGGSNIRPPTHEWVGVNRARAIGPLDTNGLPDPGGKYALISIGMSNTTEEFDDFVVLANNDPDRDQALVVVDGAQSGQTASVVANPNDNYWNVLNSRLSNAGVDPNQVVAAWVKIANIAVLSTADYRTGLQSDIEIITRVLHDKYPNIQLVYLSSRIYAGYADIFLNPEPHAYESGFVNKWVIEKQLDGDVSLNFDPDKGTVNAPWLSWGPYLWADGTNTRSDGVEWVCGNFESDGTHPSTSGEQKVAAALLDFFKTDLTAKEWFLSFPPPGDTIPPAMPTNVTVQ